MPARLLLVEDEPLIRTDLREELQRIGYLIVGEAGDGLSGVAMAWELRPDLVIMCIILPEMDGITAAQILHRERIAPVMLLTALSDEEIVARACEAGVVMYMTKPWRQSDLRPAIEVALARHREISGLEERAHTLEEQLATRRIVECAKGRLMEIGHLSERDAFRRIQRLSMTLRVPMREVGEAILVVYDAALLDLVARRPDDRQLREEASQRVIEQLTIQQAARMALGPALPRPPLPAELQARLTRIREYDQERVRAEHERVQTEQRAEALLDEFLTDGQLNQLTHEGYVEVPSTLVPGRVYRIPHSGHFPVVYEQGVPVYRLCVGPAEPLPCADLVLCHLLLITSDEQRYLAIAKRAAL